MVGRAVRRLACAAGLLLVLGPASANAQLWSGLLHPSRAIDWRTAGVAGGIRTRTVLCGDELKPGVTADEINAAITACGPNEVVKLAPGTYNLGSRGIWFDMKNNVTLRGAGADLTKLVFTGHVQQDTDCTGGSGTGAICVRNSPPDNWSGEPQYSADWVANYDKGTTVITLSNTTGLKVGSLLLLDQLDDPSDNGGLFVSTAESATAQGSSGAARPGRGQVEMKTVTDINPVTNQVTISPGLYMPNWRAGQNPGAWWGDDTISGVGIEDLSIDNSGSAAASIFFNNALNSWVKGVKSITPGRSHVWIYLSARITVRDSYFYGTQNAAAESYGVETFPTSDSLIENNIFQRVASPIMLNGPSAGTVIGYNFATDNFYLPGGNLWMQPHTTSHDFNALELIEGNDGQSFQSDNIHGTHVFQTLFRNFYYGDATKDANTTIVHLWSFSRYFNLIGNVLGRSGFYDLYEKTPLTLPELNLTEIYSFGEPDSSSPAPPDPKVRLTLMRWGNYDTVSNTSVFNPLEVPSSIGDFSNAVPASLSLPPSLYRMSKPRFFGNVTWPPIGPDVSGGNVPGYAGHANRIPARVCFETTTVDTDGTLKFSAAACYPEPTDKPQAPRNLRIIP